jgi:hypothetical protein
MRGNKSQSVVYRNWAIVSPPEERYGKRLQKPPLPERQKRRVACLPENPSRDEPAFSGKR